MSRYDRQDIMMELVELAKDLRCQIAQQLAYYRASVYKQEAGAVIEKKIQHLKTVADILGDEELQDAFSDYEVTRRNPNLNTLTGECLLSLRTMNLLQTIDLIFARLVNQHTSRSQTENNIFAKTIHRHRHQILALCQQDSRQWRFFNGL